MKIIDIINQKAQSNETSFSFEYFPPKTDKGIFQIDVPSFDFTTLQYEQILN